MCFYYNMKTTIKIATYKMYWPNGVKNTLYIFQTQPIVKRNLLVLILHFDCMCTVHYLLHISHSIKKKLSMVAQLSSATNLLKNWQHPSQTHVFDII